MALGELNVEEGDQGVQVVVATYAQVEGGGEGQVLFLDGVHVHLLRGKHTRGFRVTTSEPSSQDT